jgi:hypothetical protein
VFRGHKLPKTHSKLIVGATTVVKRDITPTDAPIHALVLINPLQLHLSLPVEPTLFLLLPSKTMPVGESTMWSWKKRKKLMNDTSTVVLFYSGASHSFSYLLHMLVSIICP